MRSMVAKARTAMLAPTEQPQKSTTGTTGNGEDRLAHPRLGAQKPEVDYLVGLRSRDDAAAVVHEYISCSRLTEIGRAHV